MNYLARICLVGNLVVPLNLDEIMGRRIDTSVRENLRSGECVRCRALRLVIDFVIKSWHNCFWFDLSNFCLRFPELLPNCVQRGYMEFLFQSSKLRTPMDMLELWIFLFQMFYQRISPFSAESPLFSPGVFS